MKKQYGAYAVFFEGELIEGKDPQYSQELRNMCGGARLVINTLCESEDDPIFHFVKEAMNEEKQLLIASMAKQGFKVIKDEWIFMPPNKDEILYDDCFSTLGWKVTVE